MRGVRGCVVSIVRAPSAPLAAASRALQASTPGSRAVVLYLLRGLLHQGEGHAGGRGRAGKQQQRCQSGSDAGTVGSHVRGARVAGRGGTEQEGRATCSIADMPGRSAGQGEGRGEQGTAGAMCCMSAKPPSRRRFRVQLQCGPFHIASGRSKRAQPSEPARYRLLRSLPLTFCGGQAAPC